ncbi:hypothetical protein FA95DRAFT_1577586 [Auriscalpium vulgare]|uniref:Uncharacterized protein n=1 Tax=Auriscalpium vulgare TaxID=40419 RepID=A0ACB8R6S6_9AGAM|nr:hypothetical protein FA95DRAFT_1577586 [Auriscalpium vulgare]
MANGRKHNRVESPTGSEEEGERSPSPELTPAQKRTRTLANKRAQAAQAAGKDTVLKRSQPPDTSALAKASGMPRDRSKRKAADASVASVVPPRKKSAGKAQHENRDDHPQAGGDTGDTSQQPAKVTSSAALKKGGTTQGHEDLLNKMPAGAFDGDRESSPVIAPVSQAAFGNTDRDEYDLASSADEDLVEVLPEKNETWDLSSGEDSGSDSGQKKGSKLHKQFKAGVPQWEADDASGAPLSARERELQALADADLSDFDPNVVPRPTERTTAAHPSQQAAAQQKQQAAAQQKQQVVPARKGLRTLTCVAGQKTKTTTKTTSDVATHLSRPASSADMQHQGDSQIETATRTRSAAASVEAAALETNWPSSTDVVRIRGRRMTLGDQSREVREVISKAAADEVPYGICFDTAYPSADRRVEQLQRALIRAATSLNRYAIAKRLKEDEAYVMQMIKIPEARVSNYRKKFKDVASHIVKPMYNLSGIPESKYIRRLKKMRAPDARLYIFPGDFATLALETGEPFFHPAVIAVIREVCFGPTASPRFSRTMYAKIGRNQDIPELPRSMVAMAATADCQLDAALSAYDLSPEAPTVVDFTADQFGKVYKEHWTRLRRLKKTSAVGYSRLMSRLYHAVSQNGSNSDVDTEDDMQPIAEDDFVDDEAFLRAFGEE